MKSTVAKITESAKRRDTIGRNKVKVLSVSYNTGETLLSMQNQISSDNIEKITNVILFDKTTNSKYLLKYRIMEIDDSSMYESSIDIEPNDEVTGKENDSNGN